MGFLIFKKTSLFLLQANQTKHVTENEFQFKGVMMNLMGFLMPGAFKKQSYKYLKAFKTFAEK